MYAMVDMLRTYICSSRKKKKSLTARANQTGCEASCLRSEKLFQGSAHDPPQTKRYLQTRGSSSIYFYFCVIDTTHHHLIIIHLLIQQRNPSPITIPTSAPAPAASSAARPAPRPFLHHHPTAHRCPFPPQRQAHRASPCASAAAPGGACPAFDFRGGDGERQSVHDAQGEPHTLHAHIRHDMTHPTLNPIPSCKPHNIPNTLRHPPIPSSGP